jgi:hypothetical protein
VRSVERVWFCRGIDIARGFIRQSLHPDVCFINTSPVSGMERLKPDLKGWGL